LDFHNQDVQDPARCQNLIEVQSSIIWLKHESTMVRLTSPNGPQTRFKIFGSPFSPARGKWAFGYSPEEAGQLWGQIPTDCDIIVTHTPPKFHCDMKKNLPEGCDVLRKAICVIRPCLVVCGHIHEGRGAERIRWSIKQSDTETDEFDVEHWEDPGKDNKKDSLFDLSSGGGHPIHNDRATHEPVRNSRLSAPIIPTTDILNVYESQDNVNDQIPREPRKLETVVVNAAIVASSWPHAFGGRKFNKPIVIDIDLPVYNDKGIDST